MASAEDDLRVRRSHADGVDFTSRFDTAGARVPYDVNPDLRLVYVRRVGGRASPDTAAP